MHSVCEGQMCTVYVRDRCAQCMSGTDPSAQCMSGQMCTVYVRDRCAQCM